MISIAALSSAVNPVIVDLSVDILSMMAGCFLR